jgi:hypothetical protein
MQRYKSSKQAFLGGMFSSPQILRTWIFPWLLIVFVTIAIVSCGSPSSSTRSVTTPTATATPTALATHATQSRLWVSLSSFNAKSNCSYDVHNGWTCIELLSSNQDTQSNLNWSASGGITGTRFNPQNGTIEPGKTARVIIFVPNTVCPTNFTFSFGGPINTVPVSWSCAAPILIAMPSSLDGLHGCGSYIRHAGWDCIVSLSSSQDSQGGLKWYASGGISGTTFDPPDGTIYPGNDVTVAIHLPVVGSTCPVTTNLVFSGSSTASVSWSCLPTG